MISLSKDNELLKLPEQLYGKIKRVGILNDKPILYGDPNLLKQGQLYYISGLKQVYKYIGAKIDKLQVGPTILSTPRLIPIIPDEVEQSSPTTYVNYYFDTIEPITTDSLQIPEEQRGVLGRAGYLFNEIIYTGDPNLVDNGSLYYHSTLPYISIISNVDGIINLSTKVHDERYAD